MMFTTEDLFSYAVHPQSDVEHDVFANAHLNEHRPLFCNWLFLAGVSKVVELSEFIAYGHNDIEINVSFANFPILH